MALPSRQMLRVTVVSFALVAALIGGAPAAFAQAPAPSVATTYGSVVPSYLSGTESPRWAPGRPWSRTGSASTRRR